MATLKINGFPDALHRRLKEQAKQNGRSLSQEVIYLLDQALGPEKILSIQGLRGLGKEIWKDVDAAEYVHPEQDP